MLKYDDGAEAPLRPDAVELCRAFAAGRLLPVTAFLVGLDAKKPVPKREEVSAMLRDCWRTAGQAPAGAVLRGGSPAAGRQAHRPAADGAGERAAAVRRRM